MSLYIIGLSFYYFLHSILAATTVKKKLQSIIPTRYYRLFYNVLAVALFILVLYLYKQVSKEGLFDSNIYTNVIGSILLIVGLWLNYKSMKGYNLAEFLGTKYLKPNSDSAEQLSIKGLNAVVRHPLYLGALLIVWGYFLVMPNTAALALAAVTSIYLPIGIYFEEKKLIKEYGNAYLTYRKEVKMIIPYLI